VGLLAGDRLPHGAGHPMPVRQASKPAWLLKERTLKARHRAGFVAPGAGGLLAYRMPALALVLVKQ
jgi:hypothetical protein